MNHKYINLKKKKSFVFIKILFSFYISFTFWFSEISEEQQHEIEQFLANKQNQRYGRRGGQRSTRSVSWQGWTDAPRSTVPSADGWRAAWATFTTDAAPSTLRCSPLLSCSPLQVKHHPSKHARSTSTHTSRVQHRKW